MKVVYCNDSFEIAESLIKECLLRNVDTHFYNIYIDSKKNLYASYKLVMEAIKAVEVSHFTYFHIEIYKIQKSGI